MKLGLDLDLLIKDGGNVKAYLQLVVALMLAS